jgi:hypothetical protein
LRERRRPVKKGSVFRSERKIQVKTFVLSLDASLDFEVLCSQLTSFIPWRNSAGLRLLINTPSLLSLLIILYFGQLK